MFFTLIGREGFNLPLKNYNTTLSTLTLLSEIWDALSEAPVTFLAIAVNILRTF